MIPLKKSHLRACAVLILLTCIMSGCEFDMFGPPTIIPVRTAFSPNRIHEVVVCSQDGGATTGISTAVFVHKANEARQNTQQSLVFSADTDHSKAPYAAWGGPDVEIEWISDKEIELRHHKNARLFFAKESIHDVKIRYRTW